MVDVVQPNVGCIRKNSRLAASDHSDWAIHFVIERNFF